MLPFHRIPAALWSRVHRVRLLGAAATCLATGWQPTVARAQGSPSESRSAPHGVDLAYRDTTCAACHDFFQYANGGWVKTAVIPAAYPSWGAFAELYERQIATGHDLLESLRTQPQGEESGGWKVGHFYGTCMDSSRAEADGLQPLAAELARIEAVASPADVRAEIGRLHRIGVGALFNFAAAQDAKHSADVIGDASQGGLGLPDRDYYLRADSASQRTRREYVAHIARTLVLSGVPEPDAATRAERVMALETALATASMTIVQREDPQAIYHRMTAAELGQLTPSWSWPSYFRELGRPDIPIVNVEQPGFFTAVDGMLHTVPLDDWKAYLRWQYAAAAAPFLTGAFVAEDFRFNSVLTGAKELLPRWKRCFQITDGSIGEAFGKVYVDRAFPPDAKARALDMVRNMEAALHDDLLTLPWMSEATRKQAIVKLAAFGNKIGYPDRWRDYSKLSIADGPFWTNVTAAAAFENDRQLAKIGKPLDRAEWHLTPATVNAEYTPTRNDIAFPAAILQPPLFDPSADDASNYGAIGMVIGHEMTHGFDDQGRQFDADGNLRDWWTADDAAKYNARAARLVAQYDRYIMIDTVHVNGKQTLGENIADLGGLKIAYAAMERALKGKPRPLIDGLTAEQRFFIAFAQVWRETVRPERIRQLVQIDVHSPGRWRVNGALANTPEFAAAFHCQQGDGMVRPDSLRGQIW